MNTNGDVSNTHVSNDKKIRKMILGLGKTGLSCARYFSTLGVPFSVMDAKSQPGLLSQLRRLDPEVTFSQLEEDTRFSPQEIDELIVSPGIPLSTRSIQQAISDGIGVNGDVIMIVRWWPFFLGRRSRFLCLLMWLRSRWVNCGCCV